jgi:DNA-binding XRE family transcriptional regulator
MLVNEKRGPGIDTCTAIARALNQPIEIVYRAAGILPPQSPEADDIERLKFLASKLPPEDRQLLIEFALMRLQKQKPPDISAKPPHKTLKAGENPALSV